MIPWNIIVSMARKSEGMLRFERETAELEKRIERGEFNDPLAPGREYDRILQAALPEMTDGERDFIQHMQLQAHQLGAEILAKHGQPVPGNDPKKPN
jgi:hypothetical protein